MTAIKKFFLNTPAIVFILILAFLLRLLLLIGIFLKNPDGIYVFDSYGYWQIAYNIVHHFSFSQSYDLPIESDYFRTPLYPLFIVLAESIGPEGFSIIFLQIVISVLTCYFTYRIAVIITQSLFVGNIAALLVAIDVPSIVLSNLVLTETLFTFLLVFCFYFFFKYLKNNSAKHLIYFSILSGLMILCRPIAFLIPFFFSFFIVLKNKKNILLLARHLVLLSGLALVTISPWLIRNKIVYDHYFLSVIREHNLLNYQAAAVYAEEFNHSLPEAQSILRWKTFRAFKGDANKQPYEYAKYIEQEGMKIIFDKPGIFLKQHLTGLGNFFIRPTRSYIDIQLGHWGKGYDSIPKDYPILKYLFENNSRLTIALVFFQLFILLIVYLTAIAGLPFKKSKIEYFFMSILIFAILIFANFHLSVITESRFRAPVWPLIAILSAWGINHLREKVQLRRKTADRL